MAARELRERPEILETDTAFSWGYATDICSRCGEPITTAKVAAWGKPGEDWYQFHPACVGVEVEGV